MFGSLRSVLGRGVIVGGLAIAAAVPALVPSPAHAWWYGYHPYGWHYGYHPYGYRYGWRPGVVVVRPGPVVVVPRRAWVPAHWWRGYWVGGHWG